MAKIKFMNIEIDNLTMDEAIESIDKLIKKKIPSYIVTPNVDHIVKLQTDNEFKKAYDNATLVLTDGKPLIWISRLYKNPIKEKISGSDLFPKICKLCAKNDYKMFLLGAAQGVAKKAAQNLIKKYKGLNIVGTYSPSFGFENNQNEIKEIINIINMLKPDVLIVGLGAPKQEKFIYKYKDILRVPLSLGLGASIDFEAGNVKRAPRWVSNIGMEWFYRMTQDPKRLIKRYLLDDIKIIGLFFKYKKEKIDAKVF